VSVMTENDINEFVDKIRKTIAVIQVVIEKYMVSVLSMYQQSRTQVVLWFNGEQLTFLGMHFTPIETEATFTAREIEDYPRVKDEVLSKWGISLDAYISIMPEHNTVFMKFGPRYCPNMDAECLIKHIPQITYLNCVGENPPGTTEEILAILMSDPKKLACATETTGKLRFIVRVSIDTILSNLRDLAISAIAFTEAVQLPPPLTLILNAYAMESLNKIDNIMSKRVGMVFMIPPALVIGQVRDAYNSVASLVQMLASAMIARQAIRQ